MSKYIIFGCGEVGEKVLNKLLAEKHEILCFCDNNPKKWGTLFHSYHVLSPDKVTDMQYDYIAIAVYKASFLIKEQLLKLGIHENNIVIPLSPTRIFPLPVTEEDHLDIIPRAEYFSESTIFYRSLNLSISDYDFLEKLEHLKNILHDYKIPRKDVCVVSGAVLQAHGLRPSKLFDDIDIIMTSKLRDIYGHGLVIVSEFVEMHPMNEYSVSDDEIINNPSFHFIFKDLKFVNLDIEMQKRNLSINDIFRP